MPTSRKTPGPRTGKPVQRFARFEVTIDVNDRAEAEALFAKLKTVGDCCPMTLSLVEYVDGKENARAYLSRYGC